MAKVKSLGFGFIPAETTHHFLLRVPRSKKELVRVFERYCGEGEDPEDAPEFDITDSLVELSQEKWDAVKDRVEIEFNKRLKSHKLAVGAFRAGDVLLERLTGKELMVLLWAIEDADPNLTQVALKNWLALEPEERWWLYSVTRASSSNSKTKRGWRLAIRYALTESR